MRPGVAEPSQAFVPVIFGVDMVAASSQFVIAVKACEAWMPRSLNPLLWLTLGAFAVGTEGFMIAFAGPGRDLDVGS